MSTEAVLPLPLTDEQDLRANDDDGEFIHFYDMHPTKEDLMGESVPQSNLIRYLLNVLSWLLPSYANFVIDNLNIYQTPARMEYPLAPDIAVFKGVVVRELGDRSLRSWRLYEPGRTPPQVVFEFASDETWQADLEEKPAKYALLRAHEYFAYDPNQPPYWPQDMGRLRGWRLLDGVMVEQACDARGWLWSAELDSWLVPDGALLRLYDRAGTMRLTGEQAERQRAQHERQRAEAAEQRLTELQAALDQLRRANGDAA